MEVACVNPENRRGKSFLFLFCCVLAGFLPHLVDSPKNLFPASILTVFLGIYGLRVVLLGRAKSEYEVLDFHDNQIQDINLPFIDVLVSARDEEAVVGRLVQRLSALKYPLEKLKICIIDDGSKDSTPTILDKCKKEIDNLQVISRSRSSSGGKSAALNYALKNLGGEWVFILDADADFTDDILLRLIPFAKNGKWSAVQLRKAVVNSNQNLLTSCQAMEMAMDTLIQEGRQLAGGVVELRGNGALLRRSALDECGGFNEGTVTDDLDLSFRLLITGASIGILWDPPIHEEGVESLNALIKQRKRWAEGGLQRFFDYWPLLISKNLNSSQYLDLISFFLLQYALPVISFIDIFSAILTKTTPAYWPLTFIAFSISGIAFYRGCRQRSFCGPSIPSPTIFNLFISIIYLSHWFFVIPFITIKMSVFSKNLVWVKTIHKG
ncbi:MULTISPECIES: glycosyltransferase [unclassified Prochlorococcus]|uniref:glycosyltransferase n=1 Tax=unclassified Prochlorococcus TaxID=2627481 RepID=UPI000533A933|nr:MULTISPECIES: glycosyltransferase family 2 protein [unclassified Prochlorococcus]KGG14564.1 Glycosyltransferase [Prochlorococcus sp. MIT 0602]KGG16010.1 Glycosyltransferase [Prochlorococcus sp. MIT 0603]